MCHTQAVVCRFVSQLSSALPKVMFVSPGELQLCINCLEALNVH